LCVAKRRAIALKDQVLFRFNVVIQARFSEPQLLGDVA